MATKNNKTVKKESAKPPVYKVVVKTSNLAVARAIATLAKCAHEADPQVTSFDAPLPGCGGPGDPC